MCANLLLDPKQMEQPWSSSVLDQLLGAGFRHFGGQFYQPHCPSCQKCQGMVLLPAKIQLNRSQKRVLAKNLDLQVQIIPALDVQWDEHLHLLESFHHFRHQSHEWPLQEWSANLMKDQFASLEQSFVMEVRLNGELLGASCLDLTDRSQNHIYAYHHPDYSERSLGTFMILKGLELADQATREYVYLGLWNGECPSLRYKANYKPHLLLTPLRISQEGEN